MGWELILTPSLPLIFIWEERVGVEVTLPMPPVGGSKGEGQEVECRKMSVGGKEAGLESVAKGDRKSEAGLTRLE